MAELMALVGGDEFRATCVDMDRSILAPTNADNPRVVIVPTAAASENPGKAAANGVDHFARLGADSSSIMVLNAEDANDESIIAPVDSANVIYLSGGNPAHLLDVLRASLLLDRVRQAMANGAILAGSSAGAMVMGSWMRFRGFHEALGIATGIVTLPHHERSDPDSVLAEISGSAPPNTIFFGIDGASGCLGTPGGRWDVLGSGHVTVYRDGSWKRYASGDNFSV